MSLPSPRPLPSASVEGYLNPAFYPILYPFPRDEELKEWQGVIEYDQIVNPENNCAVKPKALIYEEGQFLLGSLRFVDHYLWNGHSSPKGSTELSRLGRVLSKSVLDTVHTNNLEIDDLQQILRLQVIRSIRSYRAGSGSSVFNYLGYGLVNEARKAGGRAIKGGFSSRQGGDQSLPAYLNNYDIPFSQAVSDVFTTSTEDGYSDALAALESHPNFHRGEELKFVQAAEEDDERFLPYEQRAIEPELQASDGSSAETVYDFESASNLDRIFNILEAYEPGLLTEKEKLVLRLKYEVGMKRREIGQHPEINRKSQMVYKIITAIINKIRSVAQETGLADLV